MATTKKTTKKTTRKTTVKKTSAKRTTAKKKPSNFIYNTKDFFFFFSNFYPFQIIS
jgi:hypothetical protein